MTLKVSYDELRREVGRFLGFDRNPDNWDSVSQQDVADVLKRGQRRFYWAIGADGGRAHLWSFLCVNEQADLTSGNVVYSLPANFVRPQSAFTFLAGVDAMRLGLVSEQDIRSMQSRGAPVGVPRYVAIRAKDDKSDFGYELVFHPTPDRAYSVEYRYEIEPSALDADNQYHIGPAVHSDLLVSACLMEADRMMNAESISPDGGIHAQAYLRQLATSIAVDNESIGAGLA